MEFGNLDGLGSRLQCGGVDKASVEVEDLEDAGWSCPNHAQVGGGGGAPGKLHTPEWLQPHGRRRGNGRQGMAAASSI